MNPLKLTKESFSKLNGKKVKLKMPDKTEIVGYFTNPILSDVDNPTPYSFDFAPESGQTINISVMEFIDIELV